MTSPSFGLGALRAPYDERDYPYARLLAAAPAAALPPSADLRLGYPPVVNQGAIGSCTAFAVSSMFEYVYWARQGGHPDFDPSRMFVYYNARERAGLQNSDAGAYIKDAIKSVNEQGICPEELWPYDSSLLYNKPSDAAYAAALTYRTVNYYALSQNLDELKHCLVSGFPFVFGFWVYDSFYATPVDHVMKVPDPATEHFRGGHAVMCVGYSDALQVFICQNSWGYQWDGDGFFLVPYAMMTNPNLCFDFWTIREVQHA